MSKLHKNSYMICLTNSMLAIVISIYATYLSGHYFAGGIMVLFVAACNYFTMDNLKEILTDE